MARFGRQMAYWGRPAIALIAAYAFALQILFTGILGASHALAAAANPADPFVICYVAMPGADVAGSDDSRPAPAPVKSWSCVLCASAIAGGAILPDGNGLFLPARYGVAIAMAETPFVIATAPVTPRLSQGPPFFL